MKILHLVGQSEDMGGVLTVIRNLQSASAGMGISHAVWVNEAYQELRQPPLDYRRSRHIVTDCPSHWRMLRKSIPAFGELRALLKREPFDVVHAHSRGALLAGLGVALLLDRPVIFTNHNYARRLGLYRWIASRKNMHMVLLTPNMARHYGLAAGLSRIEMIPACCADEIFEQPLVSRNPSGAGNGSLRMAAVGTLVRVKKWHLILEALLKLSVAERNRVEVSLWGPTPNDDGGRRYEKELREFVTSHRLEGQFLFRGNSADVPGALRSADWFLLSSTNDACSVALTEAMALGLPALVSASGGNVDMVQDGRTGLLFEPDNPEDLASKIRLILGGRAGLLSPAEIREAARPRSASAVMKAYAALYERLKGGIKAGCSGLRQTGGVRAGV